MESSMKLWTGLYQGNVPDRHELTAASFRSQGLNRVDRSSATCRHVAGKASCCEKYGEHCDVRRHIQRADAEQQRGHESHPGMSSAPENQRPSIGSIPKA